PPRAEFGLPPPPQPASPEGPAPLPPAAAASPAGPDRAGAGGLGRDHARIGLTLFLAALQPASAGLSSVFGIGRPIGEMAAASQTALTPAPYAFAIWTPIFALSIAYALWQALPARRESPLCRRIGWPLVGAFALSNLWMILAQTTGNGWHLVAVLAGVAAFALAAFLGARRAAQDYGPVSRFVVAPLLGLLAGWTLPALFVNVAGAARATEAAWWMAEPTAAAMLTVILAGASGAAVLRLAGRDWWFAGALLWALIAILAANLGAVSVNLPVAIAAAGMLALVGWVARGERRG
ncbi:MAG: hypothetical protein NZM27_03580, partial [Acetobacteraceae bacterium]|nr:hypothetical protein [Acetobacteraceae bacterium]MDW8398327.1 hypothetical protein [Acetobacteraceae bacterium]